MMDKRMRPPHAWMGGGGENKKDAGREADEPEEAMREAARPASLVHNTMPNAF